MLQLPKMSLSLHLGMGILWGKYVNAKAMALPFGLFGDDLYICWWPSSLSKARKTRLLIRATVLWVLRPQHWVHRHQGTFSLYQMGKNLDKTGQFMNALLAHVNLALWATRKKRNIFKLYWNNRDLINKGNNKLRKLKNSWTYKVSQRWEVAWGTEELCSQI